MIEGSGSGSIPLTSGSGSGSGRPKDMWIRWIRIRLRNTALTRRGSWVISVFLLAIGTGTVPGCRPLPPVPPPPRRCRNRRRWPPALRPFPRHAAESEPSPPPETHNQRSSVFQQEILSAKSVNHCDQSSTLAKKSFLLFLN